ncbi:hypothetical protein FVR03_18795 [Pontibacter qinzhouensis]|uniref:Uncharacterized protein n=1 Tax=Pontibacter qinzhouensis TaxID=2603253 RepID=A0A5C8J9W4_9BACT|nr:hypothetical protein [Pontibacter qinzhouensis]TXK33753.1 hypothetical protein FVR03_18795 [Pontibacter qinzhouensis]
MLLFRKPRKDKPAPEAGDSLDKAAGILAGVILKRQRRLASYCGRCYGRLSARGKRVALLLFCLLFGAASLWCLVQGVLPGKTTAGQSSATDTLITEQPFLKDSIPLYP